MEKKRSSFTGKLGFVLAAAGSAVGLGNLWRFPYLAAKHGGGIFLLVYLILSITFGFSLMIAEIAIGRKTGLSAIGAFNKLNKKCTFIGYIASIVPALILPYYCVIGGWVTKYFTVFITGKASLAGANAQNAADYFGAFTGSAWQSILFFAIFLGITAIIVLLGVEKGIEKVSKIMMPVLLVLSLGIAAFVCISNGIQGKWDGLIYYLKPDFANFSILTVTSAMSQLFYSMSLAMGIMITYGSYMKKDVNLESAVHQIEFFDTAIAFLAGLMIVPAVVSFSGMEGLKSGPGLMFITLPQVFNAMGPVIGTIIGIIFFILVFFAALT
jgi:NSS family neurotransmitter:Na+ symporter